MKNITISNVIYILLIVLCPITIVNCECQRSDLVDICTNLSLDREHLPEPTISLRYSYDIVTLKIVDSNIPELFSKIFPNLDDVESLHLINDNISNIEPDSFRSMPKLEFLSLNNNSLGNILPHTFSSLLNLRILSLSFNKLNNLDNLVIASLNELNVTNNNILQFNENSFKGLGNLKVLNLHHNNLTSLEYINQIRTLEILNISDNYIVTVTEYDFQNMVSLKVLDLSDNLISTIHPKLFINSHNLTDLLLINNEIEKFPNDVFYKSIQHLDLSLNYLGHIDCEQLQGEVILSKNFLFHVCHFGEQTTSIDLSENDIYKIRNQVFNHLKSLKTLVLSANYIDEIVVDAFENLFTLETLSLDKNKISILQIGTFRDLLQVETLNISWNNIETLEHGIFSGLSNLKTLDLSHNKIYNLDLDCLIPLAALTNLYLYGNPNPIDGNSFEIYDLRRRLPELKHLSIQFDDISCEDLAYSIKYVSNFELKPGENIKTHNFHGIACNPDKKYMHQGAAKVLQLASTVRSIFILMTVAFGIIVIMQCMSWYKWFKGYKCKPLNKNGESCSVNLLTENDHE